MRGVELVAGAVGGADHHQPRVAAFAAELRERLEEIFDAAREVQLAEVAEQHPFADAELAANRIRRAPGLSGDVRADRQPTHRLGASGDPLNRVQVARVVAREDGAPAEQRERFELDRKGRAAAEAEVPECRHERQPAQADRRRKLVASLQNGVRKEDVDDVDTLAPQQLVRPPKRPPSVLRQRPLVDRPVNRHALAHLFALGAAARGGEHVHLGVAAGERLGEPGRSRRPVPVGRIGAEDHGDAHGTRV